MRSTVQACLALRLLKEDGIARNYLPRQCRFSVFADPVTADPSPVATGPSPVATGPSPAATGPSPAATGPSPVATGPSPVATGPSPVATGPSPAATGPSPAASGLSPVTATPGARPVNADRRIFVTQILQSAQQNRTFLRTFAATATYPNYHTHGTH